MPGRRDVLFGGAIGSALAGLGLASPSPGRPGQGPWLKRAFQLYNAPDGHSVIRQLDLPAPQLFAAQHLLRRPAERVSIGMMSADYMMDFHVANQPNILIPLFGTLAVGLKDGSWWSFVHGDILFAEDCNGIGHMSGAGPDGCFLVSVQLPKTEHCLDPQREPTRILAGGGKPQY
jgi:hypothetical protein